MLDSKVKGFEVKELSGSEGMMLVIPIRLQLEGHPMAWMISFLMENSSSNPSRGQVVIINETGKCYGLRPNRVISGFALVCFSSFVSTCDY